MKKITLITTLFCLSLSSLYANYTMEIKGGLSLSDRYKIGADNFNGRLTYNGAAEIMFATTDNTEVGIGISYKANSPTKGEFYNSNPNRTMHLFDSIPIYGVAKYIFPEIGLFRPYIKGYLGMAWNEVGRYDYVESSSPGLHTGLGIGGTYGNVIADLSYVITQSNITFYHDKDNTGTWVAEDRDATLTSITLTLGYKFEIKFLN